MAETNGTHIRLAIVGSRTFNDMDLLEKSIVNIARITDIACVISGGASGADTLAEKFALKYGIPMSIHAAQWNKFGKRAGYLRNKEIVNDADQVIAFWDGASPGTKITIDLATKSGKKVTVIHF